MENVIGKDVAEKMFEGICEDLELDYFELMELDDQGKQDSSTKKIISGFMSGRLVYKDGLFDLNLIVPIKLGKEKMLESITIREPSGSELRAMSNVKKKSDDVGKSMAVLGEVTGQGLPVINKMGSRDMMTAVAVISLFL